MATFNATPINFLLGLNGCPNSTEYNRVFENDVTFWCGASRINGQPQFILSLEGVPLSRTFLATPIEFTLGLEANSLEGLVGSGTIEFTLGLSADVSIKAYQANWVEWSKIGDYSFIRDKTNEAGDRPMEWNGWAWQVKQLEDLVIVYGDNGITVMNPVESPAATWGFKELGNVGIASPWSLSGNDFVHFFISSLGELWRFDKQGPVKLGFQEFLSPLTNPVLLYDEPNNRLFISDGTSGFVYDTGLGGGYAEITGVSPSYYVGSSVLVGIPANLMTDTIDLGHRGIKTITFVEIGTDTTEDLYVSCDFRYTKKEAWRTSDWILTNPEGVAKIDVAAVEFRIRVKQDTFDEIRLDYINVRHQRSDRRFLRGPIFEQPDQGEF